MRETLFRQLVQQRNWTMVETFNLHVAAAARDIAERSGNPRIARLSVSRRTFDRWLGGDIRSAPQRDMRVVLERIFGIPAERLFQPPTHVPLQIVADDAGPAAASEAVPVNRPTGAQEPEVGGERDFDEPATVLLQAQRLTRSNAEPSFLAMLDNSLHGIVGRYEHLGPRLLAGETRLLRTTLHAVLEGHQPPRTRAELFSLAARASGLLAYMSVNAGAPVPVSDAYCTEAEQLAREAGDTGMEMWARGTRSLAFYYAGRYTEAAEAARAGIALAPEHPQAIRLLANGLARALARAGDRRGAEQSIGRSLDLSDACNRLPTGLTPCIAFTPYSPARTLANIITARLSLGDTAEVIEHASEIDELVETSDSDWSRALVRLDVAVALLQAKSPELERAMTLGEQALRAGTAAPILSVWQRANELHTRAVRWSDHPAVDGLAAELHRWRARPQTAAIASGR